jgi:hypothetical protein
MSDPQQFRDYYTSLPDDQLKLVALRDDLLPEARTAVQQELKSRGLTDLEAFRRDVQANKEIARQAEGVAYQRRARLEEWIVKGFLVSAAWLMAVIGPFSLHPPPRDPMDVYLAMGIPIGASCLFGVLAWRRRSRPGFYLMTIAPLVLLGISATVALFLR